MFVRVNGVQLYYEVRGSGPAMVMVPGNRQDITVFEKAAKVLEQHFTLFMVDLRGNGQSQRVSEYHYLDMAEDMYQFIKVMALNKPIYYGHWDGGIVGLILASKHPDLLSRLIVSGTNTDPDEVEGWDVRRDRRRQKRHPDPLVKMMLEEPDITAEDLSKIRVPVLITVGEYDAVERRNTIFIRDNIPDSTVKVVRNADRNSYVIRRTEMAEIISDWLGTRRIFLTELEYPESHLFVLSVI